MGVIRFDLVSKAGKLRLLLISLGISLLTMASAAGQSVDAAQNLPQSQHPTAHQQPFLREFLKDEWDIWKSPFKKSSYSSHTVKKYVIPFTVLSGTLIATDTKTAALLPNTDDQRKWSGRVSQIGASYTLASVSAGTYLLGKVTKNKHVQETGLLSLHAFAHTQIVTFAVKQLTNRARPLSHEGTAGFWDGGNSFPSGHASTTFAVATVFAYEYREHIAVPILSYSVASVVAASRVSAQRHWVSDIVVGGSTGFLIGRYVYKRHHDPGLPGSKVTSSSPLVPEVAISATRLSLEWRF